MDADDGCLMSRNFSRLETFEYARARLLGNKQRKEQSASGGDVVDATIGDGGERVEVGAGDSQPSTATTVVTPAATPTAAQQRRLATPKPERKRRATPKSRATTTAAAARVAAVSTAAVDPAAVVVAAAAAAAASPLAVATAASTASERKRKPKSSASRSPDSRPIVVAVGGVVGGVGDSKPRINTPTQLDESDDGYVAADVYVIMMLVLDYCRSLQLLTDRRNKSRSRRPFHAVLHRTSRRGSSRPTKSRPSRSHQIGADRWHDNRLSLQRSIAS